MDSHPFANSARPAARGMTLFEVVLAMAFLTMTVAGILPSLLQTRRLASASVAQNCALTIVQGYIEQLKNIPFWHLVNASSTDPQENAHLDVSFALPTLKNQTEITIQLQTTPSTVSAATLTGATPGVTPTGVVDNLQSFDMDSRNAPGATTWAGAWPRANTTLTAYPTTSPGRTDLRMNFWVQITDLTPTASPKCKAYEVLIVYTWQYVDGARIKYAMDSIRSVRSAVKTM